MRYLFLILLLTGCGDAHSESTCWDELELCELSNQVLRTELCNMGKVEFCRREQ